MTIKPQLLAVIEPVLEVLAKFPGDTPEDVFAWMLEVYDAAQAAQARLALIVPDAKGDERLPALSARSSLLSLAYEVANRRRVSQDEVEAIGRDLRGALEAIREWPDDPDGPKVIVH